MKSFQSPLIARLFHELTLSPRRHRLHQIEGIRRAISLIDPSKDYPFSLLAFHVTSYRRRTSDDDTLLGGKTIIEDLVDLADALTESHPIPRRSAARTLYDTAQLAARFKVSAKTISRWRRRGLIGCWYASDGGVATMLFSARAVQTFISLNLDLVRRGTSFRLMDDAERARIILRARELIAQGRSSMHAVTLTLARESGRAIETIRYTLRRFDFDNPRQALFDRIETAKPMEIGRVVYEAFLNGDAVRDLARRVEKSEGEIRSLIDGERLLRYAGAPIDYIHSAEFESPDAGDVIMSPSDENDSSEFFAAAPRSIPAGLPPYLQELYRTPLLSAAQERQLFRQMNFLLHRAETARREIAENPARANAGDADEVDRRLALVTPIRNRLIQSNLRLVVSVAKRHLAGSSSTNLFELISEGNVALMRAVDKFDYGRGFRFSTYATWAIARAFARAIPEEFTQADRFRTGHDEFLLAVSDPEALSLPAESKRDYLRGKIAPSLADLDERERLVVERHFGLGGAEGGQTLDEIGRDFGISKERVRQIEMRALAKLRASLGDHGAQLLAG
ncbi:MAG TPA: sigma-70 family RNA polymerase sigma factor [Phycisphaerae bacterium]|nr:sigma-70 family RNA polymerase sigma factor [Phycisphaerae bacterium]